MIPILPFLLSPLGRKIAIYGAITAGVLIFWRIDRVNQWNKGLSDGRRSGVSEMEKLYKESWNEALKKLEEQTKAEEKKNAEIARNLAVVVVRTGEVMKALDKLTALTITLTAEEREHNRVAANSVGADAIDDALRSIARQLESLQPTTIP